MKFYSTNLSGAYIIEPEPIEDHRGFFARMLCREEMKAIGHGDEIVQVNHSVTKAPGTVRGMHYQRPPMAEVKIVKCLRGSVYDVIVDLRKGSSTLLQWHGAILSAENMKMIYVPEGFAHGFQALEPESELLYFHTRPYSPLHEGAIRYDDPLVAIRWPLPVTEVSERDRTHPLLEEGFEDVCEEIPSPGDKAYGTA